MQTNFFFIPELHFHREVMKRGTGTKTLPRENLWRFLSSQPFNSSTMKIL